MTALRLALLLFLLFWLVPLGIAGLLHLRNGIGDGWWAADRSSSGLLPPPDPDAAVVRVLAAPTVRWRGIFATHCWIVLKPAGASRYIRYDYTAWGDPIRVNGFEPDGRWFGRLPEVVFAADGPAAEAIIPRMQAAIEAYPFQARGDYRAWPGPNSNTFVAAILDAVPEVRATLPPTAIGKDFPHDGRWISLTSTGFRATIGGYLGLTIGVVEGIEVNILGGVAGIDFLRPALKLPGLGRLGMGMPVAPVVER